MLLSSVSDTRRYRRALRLAFAEHARWRGYDDFTPSAARKLKRLQAKGLRLAMAAFAHDVRLTTERIIDLCARGDKREADLQKRALAARVVGGWALKEVGFRFPRLKLLDVAAPLEVGLGPELQNWLLRGGLSVRELSRWLSEYGPLIERFEQYAAKGSLLSS